MLYRILFISLLSSLFGVTSSNAEKKAGETITTQKFGSWHYRCVAKAGAAKKLNKVRGRLCEVVQIAHIQQKGENIKLLTVSLSQPRGKTKKKKTIITVLTPLNVFLPNGLKLKIDKNRASTLKYRNCSQAGCWIQHYVNAKLMRQMKRGKFGYAKMRLINGETINVKFSLKGLSNALKGLNSGKLPKDS